MKKLLLLIFLGVGFYFRADFLRFFNATRIPISPVKDLGSVLGAHVFRFTQDLGFETSNLLPENLNELVNYVDDNHNKSSNTNASSDSEKEIPTSAIPLETVVQIIQGKKTLTEVLQEIPKEELDNIKRDFCADVVQEALDAQK